MSLQLFLCLQSYKFYDCYTNFQEREFIYYAHQQGIIEPEKHKNPLNATEIP